MVMNILLVILCVILGVMNLFIRKRVDKFDYAIVWATLLMGLIVNCIGA